MEPSHVNIGGTKSYDVYGEKAKHYLNKITFDALIVDPSKNTEVIELSDVIFDLKIFKLFNDFFFPVVAVSINLTPDQHNAICDNLDKTKFRLTIEQFPTSGNISNPESIVDQTGEVIMNNVMLELTDYDKKRFRDESEQRQGGFTDATKIQVYMELFKSEHLKINKTPIVGEYNNVTMDHMVINLLYKTGQRMLVHKSNRQGEKLPQILLPGKNLVQTFDYLQNTYGIYKSGLRLFFDYDRGYCLAHDLQENPPQREPEPIEYTNTIVYVGKSGTEGNGCWFDEETKTYYVLMTNTDQLEFADKSTKNIFGNEMVFQSNTQEKKYVNIDNLDNHLKPESTGKSEEQTGEKTKYYFNNYKNEFVQDEMLSEISRGQLKYYGALKDIDLRYISPNKAIYFEFLDDSYVDYQGMYEIEAYATYFEKVGKRVYEPTTIATFSRLTKEHLSFT